MLSKLIQRSIQLNTTQTARLSSRITSTSISEASYENATVNVVDNIAVIKFNIPGSIQNSYTKGLADDFKTLVDRVEQDSEIKGVVLMSGKPNSFMAGADINLLKELKSASEAESYIRTAQILLEKLESGRKPVVAAVMGACLGGGLESILACHYRIAVNDSKTQFALPEVTLGLMPGGGGTQRLPKLISLTNALDMILTGKTIRPKKAKSIGLIDLLVEPLGPGLKPADVTTHAYLEQVAISTAKDIVAGKLKIERTRPLVERVTNYFFSRRPLLDSVVLRTARDEVLKQTKGNYPAPLKILDVVRAGLTGPRETGFEEEAKAFGELTQTNAATALIGLFNGCTECKKDKYGSPRKTETIGIIGAGLMGAGIANVSIDKGINTVLIDTNQEGLDRGLKQIAIQLDSSVKRKRCTKLERDAYFARLTPTTSYNKLNKADVVIEAVFEDLDLKHKIVQQLESVVPEHCVIASNTSALPIKDIASASKHPERIIGMHYFSPVDKMQLLEVITTDDTSKETLAIAAKLGLAQKKLIVVVKDCPGFFAVRALSPMLSEVARLLMEGLSPHDVDRLSMEAGFPVGAATLLDEVGLDVAAHVATFLGKALGSRVQGGNTEMFQDLLGLGFKGRKNNAGIYKYDTDIKSKSKKTINEAAIKAIEKYNSQPPTSVSSDEDRKLRILSRFINEATFCLQEGVIASPTDGDVASVFGLGFPPFWGGPFRFVDLYGAEKLVAQMERFSNAYSHEQFAPSQLLTDYAKSGKKFYN